MTSKVYHYGVAASNCCTGGKGTICFPMNPLRDTSRNDAPPCDLCGSMAVRELYTAKDRLRNTDSLIRIAKCTGCGVLRTLPDMSDAIFPFLSTWLLGWTEPSQKMDRVVAIREDRFHSRCRLVGEASGCRVRIRFFLRALDGARWQRSSRNERDCCQSR